MSTFGRTRSLYAVDASDVLAENLIHYYDYGLLELGGFTNIVFSDPTTSGYTNLQRVYDERFGGHGRVYEGLGGQWVYESGVVPVDSIDAPIVASGVWVGSTFYNTASTSGTYAHYIDYRNGRVVFNSSIPSASQVKCEYAIKDVAVYTSDEPGWDRLVKEWTADYDTIGSMSPSGLAATLKQNRLWTPCIVLDVIPDKNRGLQLGGGNIQDFTVMYHIVGENPFIVKRLMDITSITDRVISLYDPEISPKYLNSNGSLYSGALPYPTLSNRDNEFFWTFAYMKNYRNLGHGSLRDLFLSEGMQTVEVYRYLSTF